MKALFALAVMAIISVLAFLPAPFALVMLGLAAGVFWKPAILHVARALVMAFGATFLAACEIISAVRAPAARIIARIGFAAAAFAATIAFGVGAAYAAEAVATAAAPDITTTLDYWWGVAGKVVLVAAGLSASVPAPASGSPLAIVFKVLNWAALNIWHAKNASAS